MAALFTCPSNAQPVSVPFSLAGNTIVVQAELDGKAGNYIVDTGSPHLILNDRYFTGMIVPWEQSTVIDFHGKQSPARHLNVKKLTINGLAMPKQLGMVLSLQNLERAKGITICGILGYSVFSESEVVFDFEKNRLLIFETGKKGVRRGEDELLAPADSFDIKMSGHIAYVNASVAGQTLRLGIDSGSEVNLLDGGSFEKCNAHIEISDSLVLKTITREQKSAARGRLNNLSIEKSLPETTEITVADLQPLNDHLTVKLDGMLGAPFLSNQKISINFKRKKMYKWEEKEVALARKE
jgi:hypothetical protein